MFSGTADVTRSLVIHTAGSTMSSRTCCVCGVLLSRDVAGNLCKALTCRAAFAIRAKRREEQARQEARHAAATHLAALVDEAKGTETFTVAAVPFLDRPLRQADPARI